MSLLDHDGVEARPGFSSLNAPPLPGDGPVMYMQSAEDILIVARMAPGEILANVWSWKVGDDNWKQCFIA